MMKLIPEARLVEIAGGGHLCHMTHPRQFLEALLGFLRRPEP